MLNIYSKFPVVITRSSNVYGPHQYPEKVKVISKFVVVFTGCNIIENTLPVVISLR